MEETIKNDDLMKNQLTDLSGEEHDQVLHEEEDYSKLNKSEMAALVEQISKSDDYRSNDAKVKHLKAAFDDILEEERNKAFQKYLNDGGEKDDFEYRKDEWEKRFDSALSSFREKKAAYLREQDRQRGINFNRKQQLIDRLRELADKIEDKNAIAEIRKIQEEWKSIGQVAKGQADELWKSYHALLDRFYNNFKLNLEFIDLDRKKNMEAKMFLIEKAEALASEPIIKKALKTISDLENEWKHIGPVARDQSEAIWQRFKKSIDNVYERKKAYLTEKEAEFEKNLKQKIELAEKVEKEFADFTTDRINEWKKQTDNILKLHESWRQVGVAKREAVEEVSKRFWAAYKKFFINKSAFYKTLYDARLANMEAKTKLCEQAEQVIQQEITEDSIKKVIELQKKWKAIGPVPDKFNDSIWNRFKSACDLCFTKKREQAEQQNEANKLQLAAKIEYCDTLDKTIADTSNVKTMDVFKQMMAHWKEGFSTPFNDDKLEKRFYHLLKDYVKQIVGLTEEELYKLMVQLDIESIKSQKNAEELYSQKISQLRKQIRETEDNIANINNNLAFFANSKNANELVSGYQEQIKQLEANLKRLRYFMNQLTK